MHFHTQESSPCANIGAAEAVAAYAQKGYDAIVVTDHYYDKLFEDNACGDGWEERIERWLKGYRLAKQEGERLGVLVLLGMELRFTHNWNDYLVYGITERILKDFPRLYNMREDEFHALALQHGLIVVQAHPFRPNMIRYNPKWLSGIEIYNGNQRHENQNDAAKAYAAQHALLPTGGSDFHEWEDLAKSGIRTTQRIQTIQDLTDVLRSGNYEVVYPASEGKPAHE